MPAGDSASAEAQRQSALAEAHARAASEAQEAAKRFSLASTTERRMGHELARLAGVGYYLLPDRGWPGSRHAQVDMVVVGPGGVFIVDTKAWREAAVEGDRLFRGQEDVTGELDAMLDLARTVEEDLAEIGLAPGEVRAVIALAGRRGIMERVRGVAIAGEHDVVRLVAGHGNRLAPAQVDAVLVRLVALFPQVGEPAPITASVPEPVLEPEMPQEVPELASGALTDEELEAAAMEVALAAPIEEWMSFLHPAQAKLVRRQFAGPSRIRGAAGTGKTVVGLHRAAYLARTTGRPILVTTFVGTLPRVLGHLLKQLAPDVHESVEFSSVHGFAARVLKARGIRHEIDPARIDVAFQTAWRNAGRSGVLEGKGLTLQYWRDEIAKVIKGRGISRFEEYAALARTGRKHPLVVEQRRAVWDLYREYDKLLRESGAVDFDDVVLMAERELEREPLPERYAAVLVDEAQDLTCAMVRLLHAVAGDGADAFTLIGDHQQSVYPGGYKLSEAGVSVANRGVVLDVNYRNTRQIAEFAALLAEGAEAEDIDVAAESAAATATRDGSAPLVERFETSEQCGTRLVEQVQSSTRAVGTSLGDVAVLCASHRDVERATSLLRRAGVETQSLVEYRGIRDERVKVGTIKRAKGLEFKRVLLPFVPSRHLDPSSAPSEGASMERWALDRRELFVAATRARDELWVGVV